MTLKSLFQKRYTLYLKNLLKYARHIVNDHFVLVFFLLIGVGGYTYSQFLETVTLGMVAPRCFVLLLFFMLTSTGNITLLLESADRVFLLPKEREFQKIFKQLTLRSFASQMISMALLTFVTFPVFVATLDTSPIESLFIFLALISLKWLNLLTKMYPFFYNQKEDERKLKLGMIGIKFLTLTSLLFVNLRITTIIITLMAVISAVQFFKGKIYFKQFFKWETMIEKEERRMQKIYQLMQMLIDVPHLKTKIRRLKGFDKTLNWLSNRSPTAPYYYILRTITRNSEYSMLILRVTIVGGILLAVTESFTTGMLLGLLFLYVIGFQLIPLLNEMNQSPQFQIYPLTMSVKVKAVKRLIFQVLSLVSIVLTLFALNGQGVVGLMLLPVGIIFGFLFSQFYVPWRIERID